MTPETDLWLVGGVMLILVALPIFVSKLAEWRLAPLSLLMVAGGGAMAWKGLEGVSNPDWQVVADAFIRVIARIVT